MIEKGNHMNERIEQLAEQCGFRSNPDIYDRNQSFDIEKFAQLIVRECCGAANDWYQKHNELHWDPAQHIRNHLGVEE
jgi:hypothetical protein